MVSAATAERFIKVWHHAVVDEDLEALKSVIDDNVEFHTPIYLKTRKGKQMILTLYGSCTITLQKLKYEREWVSDDKKDWALEFYAEVEGKIVKGLDLLESMLRARLCIWKL
ncbi:hypothetical protein BC829DRAFT_430767 [Chytridium lagenaria]|nr:hypothetical protein BC829DRAFT_430767 [Chytridium lagenaria]